ncbi:hypothetical protein [Caballeronia sp. LZ043]|uniref:hypothetical protein n=1 Tax=Caballeronia sp. LZ043 TaxID=3038569 RepID=UPI00285A8FF1|nr:hypothetical protein [Caballeronia sp. LZ043]MDR5825989.1 hypothetical protein [Caballeronia sp. LZ043]
MSTRTYRHDVQAVARISDAVGSVCGDGSIAERRRSERSVRHAIVRPSDVDLVIVLPFLDCATEVDRANRESDAESYVSGSGNPARRAYAHERTPDGLDLFKSVKQKPIAAAGFE